MKECIVCGRPLEKEIFSLENMPRNVQHIPKGKDLKADKGMSLKLFECEGCGLVQFDCKPVFYYRDVIRASVCSDKMLTLRKEQYEHFISRCHLDNKKIWEVGCGAGEFLNILQEFPVSCYGTEHSKILIEQAHKKGLQVEEGFVEDATYSSENGPFDAFLIFNYLEHQPNPNGMLEGIYHNLKEGGVGLITVPSFEYFIETASYYEFMRDHIAYYTERALTILMNKNGFDVLEISRFNEDTISMIVKKRERVALPDFLAKKKKIEKKINQYICKYIGTGAKMAVWGASHQAFTLLATLNIQCDFKFIVDSAAFKWNRYSPVSHIPIQSPKILEENSIDGIIIMAPGYSDEINEIIKMQYPKIEHVLSVKGNEVQILR